MPGVCASVRHNPRTVVEFPHKDPVMTSFSHLARHSAPSRMPCRPASLLGLAGALVLQLAFGAAVRAESDPLIARVNGAEIHASDLAVAEEDVGSNLPMTGDARRDYLTKYLSDMMLVARAAETKKLQDSADFKRRLAYSRDKLLMEMLLQQEGKASISEGALHQLYDEATKQMVGEKEIRARHVLLDTEDEAKAVIGELKKGGDFAEIAKQKSKDPSGAANGGDLGYFTQDQMVPEFADAAFNLAVGQISEPVKTQFGWHVIKLEDKRDRAVPEFDKVRGQLEEFLARRTQADLIAKLRSQAKIERPDANPDVAPLPAPGAPKPK
jgi:peptidyl-prolyl cis-trans isomerase C